MGTVWRASDTVLRRDVAVKEVILPPNMAPSDRDSMYQRTLREARAAAALSHPAVVQVYDVVTEAGRPWIVMELLQARSLAEMIVEDGPLAARAVAKIGIALLGALEVAHAAGVLHRDVKPANVLIAGDGRCVLTDFGVARMPTDSELTTPGMVLGSPHFISPERAIGAKFGPPSDLFSLGVTLYTAVEGRPPFDRRDPFETMRAVVEEPPAQAVRAGPLAGVLYGLLEKDPARRWNVETARAVLRDLLAGPLASNAPAHMTDPYAVVRPTHQPTVATPQHSPTGQIGGRAMIAPGETVSGAMRRMHSGGPSHQAQDPELERTDASRYAAYQDGPLGTTDWTQAPAEPRSRPAPTSSASSPRHRAGRRSPSPRASWSSWSSRCRCPACSPAAARTRRTASPRSPRRAARPGPCWTWSPSATPAASRSTSRRAGRRSSSATRPRPTSTSPTRPTPTAASASTSRRRRTRPAPSSRARRTG
ncbi:serine/threonine-protein kinase [Dactylosporangium cerinum]